MIKALTAWLEAFTDASPGRRLWLALLTILPIAALVGAYLWLNQPPYRTLFPRLSDQSGGEVMAALDQLDIAYQLSENDGTIQVPANQLYAARYKLAARGLPKPDTQAYVRTEPTPSFGLSQFQEQLRYQHALEAELVRSVETLAAVASARVHLAIPKASPFLRDPPPVTAAVLVQLKPQQTLSSEQVSAIQHMLAASVPRLKPTDVSVLDPQGQLLGVSGSGPEDKRGALEASLAQRVSQTLSSGLVLNHVKVQISATLAPDGQTQRLNGVVMLAADTPQETVDKARLLAREAIGFDAQRGDSLSVVALPTPPQPVKALPATPVRVVSPPQSDHIAPEWLWTVGLLGALFLVVLALRKRKAPPAPIERDAPSESDAFDALLQATRRQTLDNPRVTADVIRMWMQT
ncbi:MAG: flagellar basal-body MS-ring/collar protein FliF [Thiobacillus sp.]